MYCLAPKCSDTQQLSATNLQGIGTFSSNSVASSINFLQPYGNSHRR